LTESTSTTTSIPVISTPMMPKRSGQSIEHRDPVLATVFG
jgi:hypothetical protein